MPHTAFTEASDSTAFAAQVEGGCDCKAVRYRLLSRPLVVHCCHCRWSSDCQMCR